MQTKENYLLTIYKEHRNRPFNIYRLSMCGGCISIEKRLYACMEEDAGIIFNLNTYKKTQEGRDVCSHPKGNEMILNLCKTINALEKFDVDSMSRVCGGKKFYETNKNNTNFLKFIIMYVWDNLFLLTHKGNREDKLEYFKNIIRNKSVLEAIESMDKRYKRNVLDNPSIMKSYNQT